MPSKTGLQITLTPEQLQIQAATGKKVETVVLKLEALEARGVCSRWRQPSRHAASPRAPPLTLI